VVISLSATKNILLLVVLTQIIICHFAIRYWCYRLSSGSVAPTANDGEYSRVTLK